MEKTSWYRKRKSDEEQAEAGGKGGNLRKAVGMEVRGVKRKRQLLSLEEN